MFLFYLFFSAQDVLKLKADKSTTKKTKHSTADENKEKKFIPIKRYNKRSPTISKNIILKTQATNGERYKTQERNDEHYKTQARNDGRYKIQARNDERYKTQNRNDERYKAIARNDDRYKAQAIREERYKTLSTSAERYKTQTSSADRYKGQSTHAERYRGINVIKNKNLEKEKVKSEAATSSKVGNFILKPVQKSNKPPLKRIGPVCSCDKETNTEHVKGKKDLIDNNTTQFNGHTSQRERNPVKRENSKITINIDGDQEYYKVLLDQNRLSTDLRVNRRVKKIESQKCSNRTMSPSLENLLFMFEKEPNVEQDVSVPLCDKVCHR